ncbi:MAG: hypothetical protein ACFFBH_01445 [Promethearchaeota archaeon]
MNKIVKRLPEWGYLIKNGLEYNQTETLRTLRHIFRSLWIYYAALNENLRLEVKSKNLDLLKNTLIEIVQYDKNIFPLLLLFHDIGRPFNRVWHNFESADLIKQIKLYSKLQLNLKQQSVLYGTIKYHLLPGTIFTGESSYYGASSIFTDLDLENLWQVKEDNHIFFQILTAFTIIDILGYDYAKIFNHYFDNYESIRQNLTEIADKTKSLPLEERKITLFNALSNLDKKNFKWRLSCALRIFQFVNTKPKLTKQLYYTIMEDGLKDSGTNWENFTKSLQDKHTFIQFKYALPVLMILASFSFKRDPIKNNEKVDTKLFQFWQTCCDKVLYSPNKIHRKENSIPKLWNFTFKLPQGWFYKKEYIDYLRSEKFIIALKNITPKYDMKFDNYFINFSLNI